MQLYQAHRILIASAFSVIYSIWSLTRLASDRTGLDGLVSVVSAGVGVLLWGYLKRFNSRNPSGSSKT